MPPSEGVDEVHWIQPPALPAELRNQDGTAKLLPLSGMNQIHTPCNQLFIVPGPIDVERLKNAISSWLTLVPHAAGRLTRGEDHSWAIMLSFPIPVTVSTYNGTYTDEEVYEGFPPFMDPLPWVHFPTGASEMHPLTRFKVTSLTRTGETAIAMHTFHIVADGTSLFRMLNMLSDLYCGASVSEQIPVSFDNFLGPPPPYLDPSSEAYKRALDRSPFMKKSYTPESFVHKFVPYAFTADRVDLFFTKEQTDILVEQANASRPAFAASLTPATVLPAYVIMALNRAYGYTKFHRVLSVLGVRGKKAPAGSSYQFPSKTSGAMAIIQTVSDSFPPEHLSNLSALATDIRDHNMSCLKPETLLDLTSVYDQRQLELAQKEEMAWMLPEEGDGILGINLMHKSNVRVHFGYGPKRCRFFNWGALRHYIRAFKANPIKRADGTWDDREGDIHMVFSVDAGYGKKVRDLVCKELDALVLEDANCRRVPAKL